MPEQREFSRRKHPIDRFLDGCFTAILVMAMLLAIMVVCALLTYIVMQIPIIILPIAIMIGAGIYNVWRG